MRCADSGRTGDRDGGGDAARLAETVGAMPGANHRAITDSAISWTDKSACAETGGRDSGPLDGVVHSAGVTRVVANPAWAKREDSCVHVDANQLRSARAADAAPALQKRVCRTIVRSCSCRRLQRISARSASASIRAPRPRWSARCVALRWKSPSAACAPTVFARDWWKPI